MEQSKRYCCMVNTATTNAPPGPNNYVHLLHELPALRYVNHSIRFLAPTGAFTLATITPGTSTLRFFNLETRGNFTVPLPATHARTSSAGNNSAPAEGSRSSAAGVAPVAAVALAYCAADHVLAVACKSGDVHLLRHMHEDRCCILLCLGSYYYHYHYYVVLACMRCAHRSEKRCAVACGAGAELTRSIRP